MCRMFIMNCNKFVHCWCLAIQAACFCRRPGSLSSRHCPQCQGFIFKASKLNESIFLEINLRYWRWRDNEQWQLPELPLFWPLNSVKALFPRCMGKWIWMTWTTWSLNQYCLTWPTETPSILGNCSAGIAISVLCLRCLASEICHVQTSVSFSPKKFRARTHRVSSLTKCTKTGSPLSPVSKSVSTQ